jgi:hypothetical protein
MRAGQKAGNYVAQNNRLLYPFEKQRYDCSKQQDEGEVGYQSIDVGHGKEVLEM